jgi:hypothetical protein
MKKIICSLAFLIFAFFILSCSDQNPVEINNTQTARNKDSGTPMIMAHLLIRQMIDDGNGNEIPVILVDEYRSSDGISQYDSGIIDFQVDSHTALSFITEIYGNISVQPPGMGHISFSIYNHNEKVPVLLWVDGFLEYNGTYYKNCGNEPGLENGENIYGWRIVIN